MILYRALLCLLPRERRARDGAAMAAIFDELRASTRRERGRFALGVLWMKETSGLVRFGWRERFRRHRTAAAGSSPSANRNRWDIGSDLKWAWRGVRSRGWRAALTVGLLAVALAANAVMFSVADSLVFNRVPFRQADRIVEIQRALPAEYGGTDSFQSAALLLQWRNQTDLFSGVHGYLQKTIFVLGDGMAELIRTADITPGLIELLGAAPRWGRSIVPGDEVDTSLQVVLVSEAFARKRFGSADRAVGKRIETTADPLFIVGVMPASFSFPSGSFEIWRALDPQGPLTRNFAGIMTIARMAPGISKDALRSAMAQRSGAIGAAGGRAQYTAQPGEFFMASAGGGTTFYMLLGAALCLLLTACANVVSLELAAALHRARTHAVQLALGASRAALARVALLEGLGLITLAVAAAAGLTWLALDGLNTYLPNRMWTMTTNPVDFDARVVAWMAAAAAVTWMLVSLPTVVYASRSRLLHVLKVEDRSSGASRVGSFVRRGLTVVEVAIALLLVMGGTLYARTYQSLVAIDKGFDSRNLAQIDFTIPVQYYSGYGELPALAAETIRRVTTVPGVLGATWASAPPSTGNSPTGGLKVEIDDRPPAAEPIALAVSPVDASYQPVIGMPLRRGRWLRDDDPATSVVITETFAQRFWPGEDPVGHRIRPSPTQPWYDVVGVVGNIRTAARRAAQPSDRTFFMYGLRQPPPPPPPPTPGAPPPRATGGSWRFLNVTVRMASAERAAAVLAAAKAIDRRVRVELDFVDDAYAEMHADTLMATRVVGVFAGVAFLVAMVGVYGVMAFLVAGRTREIGIRMALGADRRDISRLVLRSAVLMVAIGAAIGIVGALVAARWTGSQFFGVSATSPWIYLGVTTAIVATSVLATWRPARSAARVDPAVTLRAE